MSVDVSVVLNLHREGLLATASLASLRRLVAHARADGIRIETIAVLDDPDAATREVAEQHAMLFDQVRTFVLRDPGLARNAALAELRGTFVAFLDGDDLWCEDWLTASFRSARETADLPVIWHPRFVYFFDPNDAAVRSSTSTPSEFAKTYMLEQPSTDEEGFDRRALLVDNLWTANVLAPRAVYRSFPYLPRDTGRQRGIEDWSWNLATVWAGIPHRTVSRTVHMVRMKQAGSRGRQDVTAGLLPHLPEGAHLLGR